MKIKDIYNITFDITDISTEDRCQMHDWYNSLINKTYNQLDLFDVTRMLIQKIFLEMALKKSIAFLEENPFIGQRYEGELMELLYKQKISHLEPYEKNIQNILSNALVRNKTYDWLCEEEREEFSNLIDSFQIKLKK